MTRDPVDGCQDLFVGNAFLSHGVRQLFAQAFMTIRILGRSHAANIAVYTMEMQAAKHLFLIMVQQHLLCGLLWVLFCVLHSVFASGAVKRKAQQSWPRFTPYYRLAYTLFAFVSLAVVVGFQLQMSSPLLYVPGLFTNIIGGLVGLAGLVLMAVCIKKYFLSLSGLKSLFRKIPSGKLMITGVHRFVRHPLYSG